MIFHVRRLQKYTAVLVLITFTSLELAPLTAGAQVKDISEKNGLVPKQKDETAIENVKRFVNGIGRNNDAAIAKRGPTEKVNHLLNAIQSDLVAILPNTKSINGRLRDDSQRAIADGNANKGNLKQDMDVRAVGPNLRISVERSKESNVLPGVNVAANAKDILIKAKQIQAMYADLEKTLKDNERQFKSQNLPSEIMSRQSQAMAKLQARKAEFDTLVVNIEQASANESLQQQALADLASFIDRYPNEKPYQYTDPNNFPFRKPDGKVRAPFISKAQYQAGMFPVKYENAMVASLSLNNIQLAQAVMPRTPLSQDFSATEDIQITQPIKELATALNNNPVAIYSWVRNNIQFVPSYGSIQGSDLTFKNRRGNAFDTASLLIALYRAAGIPARYVYGTVEVPAEKVMNWVGGATRPEAALSLLGQGGIPSTGIVSGGAIKSVRMEHVWVEAYVDFTPSSGAKNLMPNSWVPIDPSFKQYQITAGMDIKSNVPFDAANFANQAMSGASNNTTEGWTSGVNRSQVQAAYIDYKNRVDNYINQKKPYATVDDVIGKVTILTDERPVLLGTLPYKVLAIGDEFSVIPDNLRSKVTVSVFDNSVQGALGVPNLTITRSLPALASKKIALSFPAATSADQSVIDNAIAQRAATLPAYLIQVTPQLKIDDVVSSTGTVVGMGAPETLNVTIQTPWYNDSKNYQITAGDLSILGVEPAAVGRSVYTSRIRQFDLTKSSSPSVDEMLYQSHLAYWVQRDAYNLVQARQMGALAYQLPSHGIVSAPLSVTSAFGIPIAGLYKSRSIDIQDDLISAVNKNNDSDAARQFMRLTGARASMLESTFFDQLYQLPYGTSISAAKALDVANSQGMRIYTITGDNINQALPQLTVSDEVKRDISNAVSAGHTAVVPQSEIEFNGYRGVAYVLEDKTTGVGAYLISGGRGGGNSPNSGEVIPVPQVPATAGLLFVIGSLAEPFGATVLATDGVVSGIVAGAGTQAVAGAGGVLIGGGEILIAVFIIALIILFILWLLKSMMDYVDKNYPKEQGTHYRHLTNQVYALFIWQDGWIRGSVEKPGQPPLTLGEGVYLTTESYSDCPVPPDKAYQMAQRYEIPRPGFPDPDSANGYVDIIINRPLLYPMKTTTNGHGGNEFMVPYWAIPIDDLGIEFDRACTVTGLKLQPFTGL
jgi:transglutaminase-like putative cysteine protease